MTGCGDVAFNFGPSAIRNWIAIKVNSDTVVSERDGQMGPFTFGQTWAGFPSVVRLVRVGHPQEQAAVIGMAKTEMTAVSCSRLIFRHEHGGFANVVGAHPHGDGALGYGCFAIVL